MTIKTSYRSLIILLLGMFISLSSFAQGESDWWYFGNHAGIHFQNGQAVADTHSAMASFISCASISDKKGKLLFYTNGDKVWNKNHQLMENGDTISNVNYLSNPNRYSWVSLIVPDPANKLRYYIFTTDDHYYGTTSLYYSIVDLSYNNGLGKVISKRNVLLSDVCCKLTAVQHSDKESVWLISHKWNSSLFYSFLITKSGIKKTVISSIGEYVGGLNKSLKVGYLRISPRSDKVVTVKFNYGQPLLQPSLEIFDFDQSSGILSNPMNLNIIGPAGVEFSPDGSKLYYTSENSKINQIDLSLKSNNAIINSQKVIGTSIGLVYALQVAKNGKIYTSNQSSDYLGVINYPNLAGINCSFVDSGFYLGGKQSIRGLPIFIQSYFFKPDFEAIGTCEGDTTQFYVSDSSQVDSLYWIFDDSISGTNNYSSSWAPKHYYSDTGLYNIQMIVYHDSIADTSSREIRITPYPSANFSINDIEQCYHNNYFKFTNSSSISAGSCSYEWQFGDSLKSYDTNATHHYSREDSFNVVLYALSDYGCLDTLTNKVYVFPPRADFEISDSSQCFSNNKFIFYNTTRNDYGTIVYKWFFGDGDSSNVQDTIYHTYSNVDSFIVSLTAYSNFGCADTMSKKVFIHPMPVSDFSINDSAQCFNEQDFVMKNLSTVINDSIFANSWLIGNKSYSTYDLQISNLIAGHHQLQLIPITANGCTDTIVKSIVVHYAPSAGFTFSNASQCLNINHFQFNNNSSIDSGSMSFYWEFDDFTFDSIMHTSHQYLLSGQYNVKLKVESEFMCSDSISKAIIIHPNPVANFIIVDSSQCLQYNYFLFINTSSVPSGIITSNHWELGNGDTSIQSSLNYSYLSTDTFEVELVVSSNLNCNDTIIKQLIVGAMPIADFEINDSSQCFNGHQFSLENKSSVLKDSIIQYQWIINKIDTITNY
ncbi:MAG: PKD domain-containing protein, partial [Bacteroidetes bacterium]|nr:PKD domain-containing protein [Bacteroidota bacterium]